jgi:glyoxylase-like metal-dependent hydrolase (beta-lactamase superfamily II)
VVRWGANATFAGPGSFQGLTPNGARIAIEGADVLRVRDGKIVHNDAYFNALDLLRQLGASPAAGSTGEQRMTALINARNRLTAGIASAPEEIADGVWVMRGGFPHRTMNVYFIEEPGGGVTLFDAGIKTMARHVLSVGRTMGGINRVVLGHAHVDHRGTAPAIDAPIWCHPDEVEYAEGDGHPYADLSRLPAWTKAGPVRAAYPFLFRIWDGGPVKVDRTIAEGESVAGFEVLHVPGHAPGMIALWRERDRLVLASDTYYSLDTTTGDFGPPRLPLDLFNLDTAEARASLRKVAALEPRKSWSGHADPVTHEVRAQLEEAAAGPA